MKCQKCESDRIASFSAKCRDLSSTRIGDVEEDGYLPYDMGVGGGDYLDIEVCLDCGQLQGAWPLPETKLERKSSKNTKKRVEEWVAPTKYWMYLSELKAFVTANHNAGTAAILPVLIGNDDDVDRIIAGIIELHRDPSTEFAAYGLIDALYEWEHRRTLMGLLAKLWPKEYGNEFEDEEEDYD